MALASDRDTSTALQALISYDNLIHAAAGATGSVVAMSLTYPLDSVRTRLQADDDLKAMGPIQAMKKLSEEEGLETLYRGIGSVLTSLCCSNFVYFYSFNGMKTVGNVVGIKASPGRDLVFGYLSGCINAMITTPLWVANTRLKLQVNRQKKCDDDDDDKKRKPTHINGLIHGLLTIAKEDGVSALWNGVSTSFILSGNPAIHFMVYETLKRAFLKRRPSKNLTSIESFILGGLAKCVATVVTYPLQLVQCRQRANKRAGGTAAISSMVDVFQDVIRTFGISGLYKGMETKLFQAVLTSAIMFLAYERIIMGVHSMFEVVRPKGDVKLYR